MIKFKKQQLKNGLKVIFHKTKHSEMAVVNVLYDVGAKDEISNQTGLAHLFEHLMFSGSKHIKHYDEILQKVGGENNAYTTNDFTNYYIQLPKKNIETALWLESDRMESLAFNQKSLDIQKKVVCEEFKEHYINKPYGDVWKILRENIYQQHPYQWMTIGKDLSHIENVQLADIKNFFFKHYNPSNAILVVCGDFNEDDIFSLIEKYFGSIDFRKPYLRNILEEPEQIEPKKIVEIKKVPLNIFYKCWHICKRADARFYATDLISDILGQGNSSLLYQKLVKEKQLFSHLYAYHLGSIDKGLIVIDGKLNACISYEEVEDNITKILTQFCNTEIEEKELVKAKNQIETSIEFEKLSPLNIANELAYYELLGDAEMINYEIDKYNKVSPADIKTVAQQIFRDDNSTTLHYKSFDLCNT